MTEKLYYEDSHLQEFSAKVISCTKSEKGYEAVLDRTAFFPEGGGQAADTGYLDDKRVLDVHEKGGIIYHTIDGALERESVVSGIIDWEKRFSRMQQHTGEHIVSGLIHEKYGYNNVGFHLGDEVCTLDLSGPLSKEQLNEIENMANKVVFSNALVEVIYPTKEELAAMEYRSKIEIEGQVRIVKVGTCDVCACCAPHVSRTGEIGLIKFINCQNYKGGVRITMVCGGRALRDYQAKEESVKQIMADLCSPENEIAQAVEHLKMELSDLKYEMVNIKRENMKAKAEMINPTKAVILFENLEGNLPRELMNIVLDKKAEICAVFCEKGEQEYRYVIGSKSMDCRVISKKLNEVLTGKGGGKPEMVQGSLKGTKEKIEATYWEIIGK